MNANAKNQKKATNASADAALTKHPMYSPSDLLYLRRKGYSDQEILAFWNRDHAAGKAPVQHNTGIEKVANDLIAALGDDTAAAVAGKLVVTYGSNPADQEAARLGHAIIEAMGAVRYNAANCF